MPKSVCSLGCETYVSTLKFIPHLPDFKRYRKTPPKQEDNKMSRVKNRKTDKLPQCCFCRAL